MKLSYLMRDFLERISDHERSGKTGMDMELIPCLTYRALERRGLVQYRGSAWGVCLTVAGRRAIGRETLEEMRARVVRENPEYVL